MLHKARFNILKTLADIFLDNPSVDDVHRLKGFIGNIVESFEEDSAISRGYILLSESLENYSEADFSKETTGLFYIGTTSIGRTASYYLSPKKINKQEAWESALSFYRNNNFEPKNRLLHHEDSIGTELLFLAATTEKILSLEDESEMEKILNLQQTFYNDHVFTWLDLFCTTLYNDSRDGGVYKGISLILRDYLKVDNDLL